MKQGVLVDFSFTYRKMQLSDKEDMVKISSKIWDGHDFIPGLYEKWIDDPKGEFTGVFHEGKLVGCGKLTFLTDTDAWLQGLRKDIDLDMKGVSIGVTKYLMRKFCLRDDITSIRFTTYIKNYASIATAEKIGFKLMKKLSMKHFLFDPDLPAVANDPGNCEKLSDKNLIIDYIRNSKFLKCADNLINLDWVVYPYSDELIKSQFIDKGECFGIVEDGQIKALALMYVYIRDVRWCFAFFDADNFNYANDLVNYLKVYALEKKKEAIQIFLPDYMQMKKWFTRMWFKSWQQDNDFCLYEFPLEKLKEL